MKNILLVFALGFFMSSCNKSQKFECKIFNETMPEGGSPTFFSSNRDCDKFIKENSFFNSNGEAIQSVKCTKK
jgi:hypothetical protein